MKQCTKEWQGHLTALGLYKGRIDGKFGEGSLKASILLLSGSSTSDEQNDNTSEVNNTELLPANITNNFDWWEWECEDGSPIPESAKPHIEAMCKLVLQPARDELNAIIDIVSGDRSQKHNDSLYPKDKYPDVTYPTQSMHIGKGAVDVSSEKMEQLGLICIEKYHNHVINGLGLGIHSIHMDRRGYISYDNDRAFWTYGDTNKFYPSWIAKLIEYNIKY